MFDAGTIAATLTLDRGPFHASLDAARSEAAAGVTVPVSFDLSQTSAAKAIAAAKSAFASSSAAIPVNFNVTQASVMRAVTAARATFKANPITVPVTFGVSQASVARTVTAAKALFRAGGGVTIPVGFGSPGGNVSQGIASVTAQTKAAGAAAHSAQQSYGGWWGMLSKPLVLWGGALGTTALIGEVAVWHLLADWVIEFSAVLIPAAIALTAFGFLAAGTIKSIWTNLENVRVIATATGQSFGIVTGGFQSLQAAVKPQVLELWGDALTLMSQKGGTFAASAVGVGHALDQLGARFTVAMTSGKGMGGIMSQGTVDIAKLGDVIGNLGGTLGNVLKAVPGFASDFLNLWVAVSRGAEVFTSLTIPALNVLLWAHGIILYGGLAVTAIVSMGGAFLQLGNKLINFAVIADAAIEGFILDVIAADGAVETFAVINDALTPWGWIALGVTALAGLIFLLKGTRSQTEALIGSLQNTIITAPTVSAGQSDIFSAQLQVSRQLITARDALTAATVRYNQASAGGGASARLQAMTEAQAAAVNQLTGYQGQLTAAQQLSATRLASLSKTYGGTATAMGLLNTAGITEKQWQDKSASGWAQIQQEVMGTMRGYQQMGVTGGALGNDLQVMNNQVSAQYTAMVKLNGALDSWIKDVTGGEAAFDAYGQGLVTLKTDQAAIGATMDGLGAASLTLNAAFGSQVTATESMIDTWRLAGVASNLQNQGIRDSISLMVPYARGSKEATAQLAALAEEAGYNGPAQMKKLVGWLGNTRDALQNVKDITNQATLQEALLTSGMQDQGTYISGTLLRAIANAELAYGGVTKLATAYGLKVAEFGAQSTPAQAALHALDLQYIKNAEHAGDATDKIAAMIATINHIPLKKAIEIVVKASGSWVITGQSRAAGPSHKIQGGVAEGGLMKGTGGPTADDIPAWLSSGEYVVKAAAVQKYGTAMFDNLNAMRLAAGGIAASYAGSASGMGSFDLREYAATLALIESADASAAGAAIRAKVSALKAAQARTYGGGLGSASLRQIENWWIGAGGPGGGTAHIAAAITGAESGFNPKAIQQGQPYATTGWGLWQITPGDSEPQAGIDAQLLTGPSNAIAAVAKYRGAGGFSPWTTFMDGAYLQFMGGTGAGGSSVNGGGGSSVNALPPKVFDRGGYLPPGLTLAYNGTGRNEPVPDPSATGSRGPLMGDVHLTLPEGTTVAGALQELSFRLTAAQMQGYAGVTPG